MTTLKEPAIWVFFDRASNPRGFRYTAADAANEAQLIWKNDHIAFYAPWQSTDEKNKRIEQLEAENAKLKSLLAKYEEAFGRLIDSNDYWSDVV